MLPVKWVSVSVEDEGAHPMLVEWQSYREHLRSAKLCDEAGCIEDNETAKCEVAFLYRLDLKAVLLPIVIGVLALLPLGHKPKRVYI